MSIDPLTENQRYKCVKPGCPGHDDWHDYCGRNVVVPSNQNCMSQIGKPLEEPEYVAGLVKEIKRLTTALAQIAYLDCYGQLCAKTARQALGIQPDETSKLQFPPGYNTNCWKCHGGYDVTLASCPHCTAANANVDMNRAHEEQRAEKTSAP